jgi:hypothetical protein
MRFFRVDAACAIYAQLGDAGYFHAIRQSTNTLPRSKIAHRMTRHVGRPSQTKVKRLHYDIEYQAQSWDRPRRVIARIEWHPSELLPKAGFIVTNIPTDPDWVVRFYTERGSAEQHLLRAMLRITVQAVIKEGKYAFHWTRLSCKRFRDFEVRLQLHAMVCNLAPFLRCIELLEAMADWSRLVPTLETDQDGPQRRASRPRHPLPACRVGGHGPHDQGHSDSGLTEAERKRQNSSGQSVEERRRWAGIMRASRTTCPYSSILFHASAAQGPKRLIHQRN